MGEGKKKNRRKKVELQRLPKKARKRGEESQVWRRGRGLFKKKGKKASEEEETTFHKKMKERRISQKRKRGRF